MVVVVAFPRIPPGISRRVVLPVDDRTEDEQYRRSNTAPWSSTPAVMAGPCCHHHHIQSTPRRRLRPQRCNYTSGRPRHTHTGSLSNSCNFVALLTFQVWNLFRNSSLFGYDVVGLTNDNGRCTNTGITGVLFHEIHGLRFHSHILAHYSYGDALL